MAGLAITRALANRLINAGDRVTYHGGFQTMSDKKAFGAGLTITRALAYRLIDAGDRMTRQDKTRQDKTRQDKTRQDKTRQDKTRQDKTRQDKTRQDKTRQKVPVLSLFCLIISTGKVTRWSRIVTR